MMAQVKHKYSNKDLDDMKNHLALSVGILEHKKKEKKQINADYTSDINSEEAKIFDLAKKINDGFLYREEKVQFSIEDEQPSGD